MFDAKLNSEDPQGDFRPHSLDHELVTIASTAQRKGNEAKHGRHAATEKGPEQPCYSAQESHLKLPTQCPFLSDPVGQKAH